MIAKCISKDEKMINQVLSNKTFFAYWGKAASPMEGSVPEYHLLVYHCLDVAAVGSVLLQNNSFLCSRLSELTGLDTETLITWTTFFLSLHDIGKFADSFQGLNVHIQQILQNRTTTHHYGGMRHDALGLCLWKKRLRKTFQQLGVMPSVAGSKRRGRRETPVDVMMEVVTGHHGVPVTCNTTRSFRDDFQDPADVDAAIDFVRQVHRLFVNQEQFPKVDIAKMRLASWWIAGLTTLCDWLGSNKQYFPYRSTPISLEKYWHIAVDLARHALDHTGFIPVEPTVKITLDQLISPAQKQVIKPTPLQGLASEFEITTSPYLFILEDVTGAGKTEAAILLAHRLLAAGQGRGLYFALPTMATANAMYSRIGKTYRALFSKTSSPSLVLAHGARELSKEFRQSIIPVTEKEEMGYGDGTSPAGACCNSWLADNKKKALLADIGVGTIDQALLAILSSRHQSLRLIGLLNKVLIVDEVHACDAYMNELLCSLLRTHAAAGGSAILLSATLPLEQRQTLVKAYMDGRGLDTPVLTKTDYSSYPLITAVADHKLDERIVDTREEVKRDVQVQLVHAEDEVERLLTTVVAEGRCACWIRNTVADARETWRRLRKKHPDWDITLFHARFMLGDRLDIENMVVGCFGKKSGREERCGRILIATQVVEQSLDIDFDEMVTDLAPIDLIIQRSGRLRRHSRDTFGNVIAGQDARGAVLLHVFAPPVIDDPPNDWIHSFSKYTALVYPHHGQLFLTADLLQRKGTYNMPADARELIESVYGFDAQERIPESLLEKSYDAVGDALAATSLAGLNSLYIPGGYGNTDETVNKWWDEAITPTRLGEETTTVYLAMNDKNNLIPLRNDSRMGWAYSSLSVRTRDISGETPSSGLSEEVLARCKAQLPAKGKWGVLVIMESVCPGSWQGRAINGAGEEITVWYCEDSGLLLDKEYQQLYGADE